MKLNAALFLIVAFGALVSPIGSPAFDSSQTQPASGVSEGVKLEPAQLRDLLHKVYVAAFRFTDLLSILQTDKWETDDRARQSFSRTLETVRGQLKALEEIRQQFQEQPENPDLAEKTDGAIGALLPNIEAVAAAVALYDSPAQGTQYRQPGDQLRELEKPLRLYATYLRPARQAPTAFASPPSVQVPQARPPQSGQAQPAPAVTEGSRLEPAQLSDMLHKVYLAAFRFNDLLSILEAGKWRMDDAERQAFNQTLETLHGQLRALDESRQQFQGKPENSDWADKTDAAITALLPNIDRVAAVVSEYDSPAQGTQYKQPGDRLRELQALLGPYVRYLHARAEAVLAAPPGVQTEVIQSSTNPAALRAETGGPPPPVQPGQLKEILRKMYMSVARIEDLLSQERPEKWKASDAERAGFEQARKALRAKLAEFEAARSAFADSPASADLAFQAYRAAGALEGPLDEVSHSVSEHENVRLGDEYQSRGSELAAGRELLAPYISYFLNRWDRATQMFQNDLAACESQLSTAMRTRAQVATPLPNVNPEFQGHGRKTASNIHTAPTAAKRAPKGTKPSSKNQ